MVKVAKARSLVSDQDIIRPVKRALGRGLDCPTLDCPTRTIQWWILGHTEGIDHVPGAIICHLKTAGQTGHDFLTSSQVGQGYLEGL